MENSPRIELRIAHLLTLPTSSSEDIALQLIKEFPWQGLDLNELRSLGLFFIAIGQFEKLVKGFRERLLADKNIHWDLFCEAIFKSSAIVSKELKEALLKGAEQQKSFQQLLHVTHFDYFDERIPQLRAKRGEELRAQSEKRKSQLLEEVQVLKSQGLLEQQHSHLQKMKKIFPGDAEVHKLESQVVGQKALIDLTKKPPVKKYVAPFIPQEKIDPLVEKVMTNIELSMQEWLDKNPELAADFTIGQLMWENHNSALRFLEKSPQNLATGWLKAHLLLSTRRFVDLISFLPQLQSLDPLNPETTFDSIYFRCQALWGLGDRITAIEMLESLLTQRPDYRSAASLLTEWKAQLE